MSSHHSQLGGRLNLYNTLPRMLVEYFALVAIVLLSIAVVLMEMPMTEAGPLLGVIVIATLRAIPSFSRRRPPRCRASTRAARHEYCGKVARWAG